MARKSKKTVLTEEILSIATSDEIQEYFDDIKNNLKVVDLENMLETLNSLPAQIEKAKRLGQTVLARELENHALLIVKQRRLLAHNISKYVYEKDIVKFIEQIKGHVVKICELHEFPRVIPNHIDGIIADSVSNKLFDKYYVLFTDYTGEELLNKDEKKKRDINKDPILFGTYDDSPERFFFICDWVDDFCDITFDVFCNTLTEIDENYKPEEIYVDMEKYLNDIAQKRAQQKKEEAEKMEKARKSFEAREHSKKKDISKARKVFEWLIGKK